jgi:uncharacterized protein YodC (DUF2158 family)
VEATDLHDHGFGWAGVDFLSPDASPDAFRVADDIDWIVTNPPFAPAAEFVRVGLQRARRGVAILARASFLESAGRYPLFFGEARLAAYAPYIERVPMVLGRLGPGGVHRHRLRLVRVDQARPGRDSRGADPAGVEGPAQPPRRRGALRRSRRRAVARWRSRMIRQGDVVRRWDGGPNMMVVGVDAPPPPQVYIGCGWVEPWSAPARAEVCWPALDGLRFELVPLADLTLALGRRP